MQKKYHKLQNTVLRSFTILAVFLIIIIGFVVGDRYINGAMGNYQSNAYAYTKSTASLIDGDKISTYLETGEKDEYYNEILKIMSTYRENTDIRDFCVFVPLEDELIYIWDVVAEGQAHDLGEREAYLDSSRDFAFSVYRQNPPEAANVDNELYGLGRLGVVLNRTKNGTPDEILPAIKRDIDEFVGLAPQFDDITMLCVEYRAKCSADM